MENKKKIKLLRHYNDIDIDIQKLTDEKETLFTTATKITPTLSDMPGAHNNESKVESMCVKLADIDLRIKQKERTKYAIDKALSELNAKEYSVIVGTDLANVSIYKYARRFHKSFNSVKKIHDEAINKLSL